MQKTIYLIAAIPLCLTGLSSSAEAAREHKPWLSISRSRAEPVARKAAVENARPSRESVSIVRSKEAYSDPDRSIRRPRRTPVVTRRRVERVVEKPSSSDADPGRKIARQALAYKGTKYKFGGTSKKGLDCSGLVSRIFTDLKMGKVPRVSASLYNSGEPVRTAELRPGDLVFFKNTYKRGISHVGVYAGKNKFVHASNKRTGVIVTSMADPYYQLHYAGARRLY